MDALRDDAAAPPELAQWRADVRLRALERRAPEPIRAPWSVWVAVGSATLVLVLVARLLAQLQRTAPRTASLQVFLRDDLPPPPEPPLPEPPPHPSNAPRTLASRGAISPPAVNAQTVAPVAEFVPESAALPVQPHVFNLDGSIDLPRETTPREDALVANFSAPPRSADSTRIMTHQRPLKVRPNHFAAYARARSGSVLTDFVEDHLTASKEFTLPWGTHVECKGVALGVAWFGGCGWYTPYRYYVPQAPWRPASVLDEQ